MSPLVLVVHDDPRISRSLSRTLESAGFQVLGPTRSVDTAILLLQHHSPDAAVLDFNACEGKIVTVAAILDAMFVPFSLVTALQAATLAFDPAILKALKSGTPKSGALLIKSLTSLLSARKPRLVSAQR